MMHDGVGGAKPNYEDNRHKIPLALPNIGCGEVYLAQKNKSQRYHRRLKCTFQAGLNNEGVFLQKEKVIQADDICTPLQLRDIDKEPVKLCYADEEKLQEWETKKIRGPSRQWCYEHICLGNCPKQI